MICEVLITWLCLTVTTCTAARQALPFMAFPRQEYWSDLPFPTPGHLFNPRVKPSSPVSPQLTSGYYITALPGKPGVGCRQHLKS